MPTLTCTLATIAAITENAGWYTWPLAILGIGLLIFVHELGHFLACRATKTRVETFSIGFGSRLFGWETYRGKRVFTVGARRFPAADGAMDVRVAVVPLGGYVKMAGEIGGDGTPGGKDGEPRPRRPDEFPSKSFGARLLIITAGVTMNALAAVTLYTIAYLTGLQETSAVAGEVKVGGPAWHAGIRPGDRLVEVDGVRVRSFDEFRNEVVYLSSGETVPVVVERDGKRTTIPVRVEYNEDAGIPQMAVGPSGIWRPNDGEHPPFTVGPSDRVVISGRLAVGGLEAMIAARDAQSLGMDSATVEFVDAKGARLPGQAPREVRLTATEPVPEAKRRWLIGVLPHAPSVVRAVRPGTAAAAAGLAAKDDVVAVDGEPFRGRERLAFAPRIGSIRVRRGTPPVEVDLRVDREGPVAVREFLDEFALESAPNGAFVRPEAGSIEGGTSPAALAGVLAGDLVREVDGTAVASYAELIARLKSLDGKPVSLRVKTGDAPAREVVVTPRRATRAALEASFEVLDAREPVPVSGPFDALALAGKRTWKEVRNVFRVIRSLFAGDVSWKKNLGGPGTLVVYSSKSLGLGWGMFLTFLAYISVSLAVLNILPIPVLDGGHLLFLVIEKVKGKPLTERAMGRLQFVGFLLLMALMVLAVSNDFRNL